MASNKHRSVDRAVRILEALSTNEKMVLSDLAEETDLPVSTVYDYLETLASTGLVVRENKQYSLSTRLLEIGHNQLYKRDIYTETVEQFRQYARVTNERTTLVTEENRQAVILAIFEGDHLIGAPAYPGAKIPIYANAGGKALLACMSRDRRTEVLEAQDLKQITEETVTSREVLTDQLEAIRQKGYAIDRGEYISGLVAVAVPILDRHDTVRGAICFDGPERRMTEYRCEKLASIGQVMANIIQVNIDYSTEDIEPT